MKRKISRTISIVLALCVAFSGLPLLAGNLDVSAASVTKKKITLKATATWKTKVKLKWNKVKSPGKGYAVFRDGKVIKRLSTKKTSFTDKGLKAGSRHKYQIKTYTKKKVTKWYNKKTKKWQKKKPPKKYRGKSKKVTIYVYKKKSNIVRVRTKGSNDETSENTEETDPAVTYYTITWKNWDGSVLKTDSVKAGTTPSYSGTPTRPDDSSYTYTFKGWSPSVVAASANATYTAQYTATTRPTSHYSYDIKLINQPYGNGGKTVVYVKTNNPDVEHICFNTTDADGITPNTYNTGIPDDYIDVEFTDDEGIGIKGGVAFICKPSKAGKLTINVYEEKKVEDYWEMTKVASRTVNAKDFAAEERAWRQSVINEVTNDSMTNKEKMQAICGYILANFKYFPTCDGQYVQFFTTTNIPYWIRQETDSACSPEILVEFGSELGYSLENLYPKYTPGTQEWRQFHMCAYSAADDCYFQACPPSSTNIVDPANITMFDPDTYQFWGE